MISSCQAELEWSLLYLSVLQGSLALALQADQPAQQAPPPFFFNIPINRQISLWTFALTRAPCSVISVQCTLSCLSLTLALPFCFSTSYRDAVMSALCPSNVSLIKLYG